MWLTSSTGCTFIPIYASASVTIYSVGAVTFMLTRMTGTFVGIWNETMSREPSLLDVRVLWSMVESRLKELHSVSMEIGYVLTFRNTMKWFP